MPHLCGQESSTCSRVTLLTELYLQMSVVSSWAVTHPQAALSPAWEQQRKGRQMMLAVAGVRIVHLGVLVFLRPQERNACSQDLFKCLTGWLLPRAALLWALLPMYSDAVRRDAVRHASHVTGDNCSPPSISIHFSQGAHSQNLEMLERVLVPQQFLQCTA